MVEDDVASNKAIGSYGASFIKNTLKDSKNISILTHCNTGREPGAEQKFKDISNAYEGSSSQWVDVMKRKRAVHEEIMNLVHQKRSSEQADKDARRRMKKKNTVRGEKEKRVSSGLWGDGMGTGVMAWALGVMAWALGNPFDLFESLFENMGGMGVMGGGGRGTRTRAVDGEDEVYNLVLNFKEAVLGLKKD
ncbi:hypothetical protein IFM89_010538 [Coptis chinensis]|uniref:Uncharacterized protein n=1 Tax=Coptis chinensis TaxID=261450 RepID=A0A835MHX9_9MAGN|nr:hypothetical protein IFM89_010538 [Coptis chinensis]